MGSIVIYRKTPIVIGAKATGWNTTGDTSEHLLTSVRLPAGLLNVNDALEIISAWTFTNNTDTKKVNTYISATNDLAGTSILTAGFTTTTSFQLYNRVGVRATNSQIFQQVDAGGGMAGSTTLNSTASVDLTADAYIVFSGQNVTSGSDTVTLIKYVIRKIPGV